MTENDRASAGEIARNHLATIAAKRASVSAGKICLKVAGEIQLALKSLADVSGPAGVHKEYREHARALFEAVLCGSAFPATPDYVMAHCLRHETDALLRSLQHALSLADEARALIEAAEATKSREPAP